MIIYRAYWKLLAHYWASKCDCFSEKEISWSVGLVASLECKQGEPEVSTEPHCFFYLQKQFAALWIVFEVTLNVMDKMRSLSSNPPF